MMMMMVLMMHSHTGGNDCSRGRTWREINLSWSLLHQISCCDRSKPWQSMLLFIQKALISLNTGVVCQCALVWQWEKTFLVRRSNRVNRHWHRHALKVNRSNKSASVETKWQMVAHENVYWSLPMNALRTQFLSSHSLICCAVWKIKNFKSFSVWQVRRSAQPILWSLA